MNPAWVLHTGRLVMAPVGWQDLADLRALKGDAGVYGQMLGGVRDPWQVGAELAADTAYWAARGVGMWTVRLHEGGPAVGLAGIHDRPDGRGTALRFAFRPQDRGHGLAREAAAAALRFAHRQAGLPRVIGVAREANIGSRTVLGAIGMRECDAFWRGRDRVLVYESVVSPPPADAWR